MILQELVARYERESARGRAAPFGMSMEQVAFVLVLGGDGRVLDVQDLRDGKRSPRLLMPTPPKSTANIDPRFLYGNSAYLLGVKTDGQSKKLPSERIEKRCLDEHDAWRQLHRGVLTGTNDLGLNAVLQFIENWSPDRIDGLRYADEITRGTVALRLDGDIDESGSPRLISDRPAAREIWQRLSAPSEAEDGLCLVTGRRGPIARLHASIRGVAGTQPSGASLVSYNFEAVEHFGPKSRGLNAPVSAAAAHGYVTALNALLADPAHRIRIGDATVIFWVEAESDATSAETLLAALLSGGNVTAGEAGEAAKLRDTLAQIAAGRLLAEADPNIDPAARYHVLALGPSAARVVLRWHLAGSLGDLARRVGEHWQDMRLEPMPWRIPPSVQWLALQTVPARANKSGGYDRDKDRIDPTLPGEILQAILRGQRYPASLLQILVQRLATDRDINGIRVAMIKACLARDQRLGKATNGVPMALDPDNPSVAYQLGRLFAVLGGVFRLANPGSEGGLADSSYRMASTQPAAAFPRLLATAQHHLSAIRRSGKVGLAVVIGREIEEIIARLGTVFPGHLNTADQGRFALGYYQQRGKRQTADADTVQSDETIETEEG